MEDFKIKRQNLILSMIVMVFFSANIFALDGSGTGSDPYLIQSLADFNEFAADPNYWDDCTRLDTDIDLTGQSYTTAVIAPDTINDINIGYQGTFFTGVFDGNGHTISNLTIDTAGATNDYLGLFGNLDGYSAEIKNIGIEDCNIVGGNSFFLSGLCGENWGGSINNCYVTGTVTASETDAYYVGGLCGHSTHGTISNCYTDCNVVGNEYIGGLCGESRTSSISNCYATGDVSGHNYLGGLCGKNGDLYTATIDNCYARGSVTGVGSYSHYVGGLCGENEGTISDCYATGTVTGATSASFLGGLCGLNSRGTISNCYATGAVTGTEDIGGVCGRQWGSSAIISNSFWDIQTSGMTVGYNLSSSHPGTITNVVGKTTAQMKTISTFKDAGWDLVSTWNIEEDQIYPLLRKYNAPDTNFDGMVNLIDLVKFAQYWLEGTTP